jgi:hypothetical protein
MMVHNRKRVRRLFEVAVRLWLLPTAVAGAQPVSSADTLGDGVTISRRALTISIPFDSSAITREGSESRTEWRVTVGGREYTHSSTLSLVFREPFDIAAYRSATHPAGCTVLTDAYSCRDSATAAVVSGRFVITVRDSAMLALLFWDRPTHLWVGTSIPSLRLGSVVVRYADPQLLPASKEALAEYDRALEREGWSPWTRTLLAGKSSTTDTVWLQVGEQLTTWVREEQVRGIDSYNVRSDFTASGWTSSDSSVVALAPANAHPPSITLVALRPGRSTIGVRGLRGASDALPRSPRAKTLTRTYIVTRRLTRVEIAPRPKEIVAGSKPKLIARVIDDRGVVVRGAPVGFYVIYDPPGKYGPEGSADDADLTTPGPRRFIAYFENFADTLDVQVVPRRAPR